MESPKSAPRANPIYLDPVKVGAALKEVGIDYQEIESKEVETRWFRDHVSETDVFVWFGQNRKIIKQQVSVMGLIAEWNILEGVRTGMIMESEISAQDLMQSGLTPDDTASEVIHFDGKVQQRTLATAISILKNSTSIEPELMSMVLSNFGQATPFQGFPVKAEGAKTSLWLKAKNAILSCFKK